MTEHRWQILSLIDDSVCPGLWDGLRDVADVRREPPTAESLDYHLPQANAYFATLAVRLERWHMELAPGLRVICTPSTGTDHIDMAAARELGIQVLSLKNETAFLDSVTSTAEMAWALLLALVRRLPWSFAAAQQGDWARDRFRGHQLSGKTLGILGYGRLGRMMTDYGRAFRMRLMACDVRTVQAPSDVAMVDHETLYEKSDVVSIHVHATPDNEHLISRQVLAQMKSTAVLINTSRGVVLDEAALLDALQDGGIAGAGVDVIHGEWREDLHDHPLLAYARTHDNLVISPHTGGVTYEAQGMALSHAVAMLAAVIRAGSHIDTEPQHKDHPDSWTDDSL